MAHRVRHSESPPLRLSRRSNPNMDGTSRDSLIDLIELERLQRNEPEDCR
jgi:hypothetical protein